MGEKEKITIKESLSRYFGERIGLWNSHQVDIKDSCSGLESLEALKEYVDSCYVGFGFGIGRRYQNNREYIQENCNRLPVEGIGDCFFGVGSAFSLMSYEEERCDNFEGYRKACLNGFDTGYY